MSIKVKGAIGLTGIFIGIVAFILDIEAGSLFAALATVIGVGFAISATKDEIRVNQIKSVIRVLEISIRDVNDEIGELEQESISEEEYNYRYAILQGVRERLEKTKSQL